MHSSPSTGSVERRPLKSVTYSKEQLAIIANLKENVKSVLSRSPDNAELQVTGMFLQAALESGDPEALTEARQFLEGVRDRCIAQINGTRGRQLVPLVLEKPLEGGLCDVKDTSEALQIAINLMNGMKSMEMAGVLHRHFTPQAAAWRRKDNDDDNDDLEVFLIDHDYEMFRERNPRRPDDEENQQ